MPSVALYLWMTIHSLGQPPRTNLKDAAVIALPWRRALSVCAHMMICSFSVPWTKHREECWASSPFQPHHPAQEEKHISDVFSFPRSETNYYEQMACLSSHFVLVGSFHSFY